MNKQTETTSMEHATIFLQNLAEKRKMFLDGIDANEGDINLDIFEDFYPDQAHFVFELLQNAEDAGATEAEFILLRDGCIFEHNGTRKFTEEDVRAITGIHNSTKSKLKEQIGKFGVGFKSVFVYTITPFIYSGNFSFKISRLVMPLPIEPNNEVGTKTRFYLPFNNRNKSPADAFTEIEAGLNELAETTLLFLSHLKSIIWRIDRNSPGDVQRILHSTNHFEVLKRINGKIIASPHFLKFDQPVEGLEKQRVAVAFSLDFLPNVKHFDPKIKLAKQLKIVSATPGCVAVFFPAEKETSGLRFHLHAPFVPELSRASIKETTVNQPLFEQLAKLTAASLHKIRDMGLLTSDFLAVLPNPQDAVPDRYKRIRTAIVNEMNDQPLTPTFCKSHAPARQLLQSKISLKELLSKNDIQFLVDYEEEPPLWAIAATQKNSDTDRFLTCLKITKWDIEELVHFFEINAADEEFIKWLSTKSTDWHQQLYSLLYKELEPEGDLDRLNDAQLVRLNDGSYSAGIECFFPSDAWFDDDVLLRVDSDVYTCGKSKVQQANARKFLEEIGVREVGEAEQVEAILVKRYCSEEVVPDAKDLERFIELVEKEPSKAKIFKDYQIFRRVDGKWGKPSQVYLDVPYVETHLAAYYGALGGDAKCLPLHKNYEKDGIAFQRLVNFAKAVGAKTTLEIIKTNCYQNPNARYLVWQAPGRSSSNEHNEDYYIEAIEKVILCKSIKLSCLIWNSISTSTKQWSKAKYCKSYSQPYRYSPSRLASILAKNLWIPQGDGIFVCPKDATIELWPKGFLIDKGWEWLKDIEFGENEDKKEREVIRQSETSRQRETLARDLGFGDEETLKRAQRFAALSPEVQESFLTDREYRKPSDLPEHEPSNAEHRAQRVALQAAASPERVTEKRTRSVSIGLEAVKEEAGQYLSEQYTNDDNELICQICKAALPFTLDDGSPYFERVKFLPDLKKQHYQNYLALCPNHSAMFQHVNRSSGDMREIFGELTGNELTVILAKKETTIYFTKTHIHDLINVIKGDTAPSPSQINIFNNNESNQYDQPTQNSHLRQKVIVHNNQSRNPLQKEQTGKNDSKKFSNLIKTSKEKTKQKLDDIQVFMHPRPPRNDNSSNISRRLKSCPYCQAGIGERNFDKHVNEKCPKKPAQSKIVPIGSNSYRISRCRHCGMPAMQGSDTCYSCG